MDILPNSRTKEDREVKRHHILGNVVQIYCANCPTKGPMVPIDGPPFAFWLCNDCVTKHGVPAAMMCQPDEQYWQEIYEERAAKAAKESVSCSSIKQP